MTHYTSIVSVDVRNTDEAFAPVAGENAAAYVIDQLIEGAGSARGISVDGDRSGDGADFPVTVEAADINDADTRLTETFRPRRVEGVDYAISWTLPRSANGGFFD